MILPFLVSEALAFPLDAVEPGDVISKNRGFYSVDMGPDNKFYCKPAALGATEGAICTYRKHRKAIGEPWWMVGFVAEKPAIMLPANVVEDPMAAAIYEYNVLMGLFLEQGYSLTDQQSTEDSLRLLLCKNAGCVIMAFNVDLSSGETVIVVNRDVE